MTRSWSILHSKALTEKDGTQKTRKPKDSKKTKRNTKKQSSGENILPKDFFQGVQSPQCPVAKTTLDPPLQTAAARSVSWAAFGWICILCDCGSRCGQEARHQTPAWGSHSAWSHSTVPHRMSPQSHRSACARWCMLINSINDDLYSISMIWLNLAITVAISNHIKSIVWHMHDNVSTTSDFLALSHARIPSPCRGFGAAKD